MIRNRVLVFDIETAPLRAWIWQLGEQRVNLDQVEREWFVLAWAAKWLGDPESKVIYRDQRSAKNVEDDTAILKELWKLLDEADIVVTQNGEKFDSRKLNARFILKGMKPPKPYKHLDTYKILAKVADFTSHKLEYLTDKLCTKYKKLKHSEFPGLSLWKECMKGNKAAWDAMKRYNIHDVLSTEELYDKVKAWAPESAPKPHRSLYPHAVCETCGKPGCMQSRGYYVTRATKCRRFQCQSCGAWQKGERIKEAA